MKNPSFETLLNPMNSLYLYGLDNEFNNLIKLYNNQKLPKIILLTGDKGIGKFTLIFHFINYIFSSNSTLPYNYKKFFINNKNAFYKRVLMKTEQNFYYIGNARPNSASIEDIRNIKKNFFKSSLNNLPRFTVLDDVELLNINAANALLKLIEEPSIYDYFILINNKKQKMIETLRSRSIEIKIFLKNEKKNKTLTSLKNNFKMENNFLDKYIDLTTPGMLIIYNYILEELKINEKENFYNIISKLIEQFKKNKNALYLDFVYFLIDIKFSELVKKNKTSLLEILEIKNKLINLFNQYRNFNLNTETVLNQFKNYSYYVR